MNWIIKLWAEKHGCSFYWDNGQIITMHFSINDFDTIYIFVIKKKRRVGWYTDISKSDFHEGCKKAIKLYKELEKAIDGNTYVSSYLPL